VAGKVTIVLASHWPCVTDNTGITTYGLMDLGREMSTQPKLNSNRSMAHFTFTFLDRQTDTGKSRTSLAEVTMILG